MKVLLVIAALVVIAYAQKPTPCVSPPQWEAREMLVDHRKHYEVYAKIAYDAINQRSRRIEEVVKHHRRDREFYDELFIHSQNKGYRLNLKTRKCQTFQLTEPFHQAQVPYNSTSHGEVYLGTGGRPNEGVLVTLWSGLTHRGDRYFGAVTSPDCIPVSWGIHTERRGFLHSTLFDVTLGISDPNHFIPPKECETTRTDLF